MMVTMRSSSSDVISPALLEVALVSAKSGMISFFHIPLRQVDISLLADEIGVTATDTLDLGQGVHDFLLSIDVGIEKTKDELEVRLLA